MNNLSKYRQLSYIALTGLTVGLLLTFAALWNSLLTSDVKHEGWVIVFLLLLFTAGVFMFILAYRTSDVKALEDIIKAAADSGKNEILREIEKRNQAERKDQQIEEDDLDKTVEGILSGMQGIRTESGFCNRVLTNMAKQMGFVQGILYLKKGGSEAYEVSGEYALTDRKPASFKNGETLAGAVADSKSVMVVSDIPETYFSVSSGLGSSRPRFLIIAPVLFQEQCIAVLELAAFNKPDDTTLKVMNKLSSELGTRLNKFVVA
jgi:two-component system, chemotaxis family, sensor kinase CheA